MRVENANRVVHTTGGARFAVIAHLDSCLQACVGVSSEPVLHALVLGIGHGASNLATLALMAASIVHPLALVSFKAAVRILRPMLRGIASAA